MTTTASFPKTYLPFEHASSGDETQTSSDIPIGTIIWYLGQLSDVESMIGWKVADGSTVNYSDYTELAAVLGISSSETRFDLPKLTDGRYIKGVSGSGTNNKAGASIDAGLPAITGGIYNLDINSGYSTYGAFENRKGSNRYRGGHHDWGAGEIDFDASRCSKIYGKSSTVTPLSLTAIPLIKVK